LGQVVDERRDLARPTQSPLAIPSGREQRVGRKSGAPALAEVVVQGVFAPGQVRPLSQVMREVEKTLRRAAASGADAEVMLKGRKAAQGELDAILAAVPRDVENRMRTAALAPAGQQIVRQRRGAGAAYIVVGLDVPALVEKRGGGCGWI